MFKNDNNPLFDFDAIVGLIESKCKVSVKKITPYASGLNYQLFLINDDFIFRFVKRMEKSDFLDQELIALEFLSDKLPLAIPKLHSRGTFQKRSYSLYKKIPGTIASVTNVSEEQYKDIAVDLAKFLKTLHAVSVKASMDVNLRFDWQGKSNSYAVIPKTRKQLIDLSEKVQIKHLNTFLHLLDVLGEEHLDSSRKLCHGDLGAGHLLINKGQLSGVIGWGDCCISSPGVDLAIVYSFLHPSSHHYFWETYQENNLIGEGQHLLAMFKALQTNLNTLEVAHSSADQQTIDLAQKSLDNIYLTIKTYGHEFPLVR